MLRNMDFFRKAASFTKCHKGRIVLVLVFVLLAGGIPAGSLYVRHQWHAAQAAMAADHPEEALERLKTCLYVWPRNPDVLLLAARAARLCTNHAAAEEYLNRCLQLPEGTTQAVQLEFLLLRVQLGEVDNLAPNLIDQVENGHPESPIILETLARAYMHRLRYKPALACLNRWQELCPDVPKIPFWRAWNLERMDQRKPAKEAYERALELDPNLFPVRLRVAEMFLQDSRAPDALPHLEQLQRQWPDSPEVLSLVGMCRFQQGQMEEARRLMEAAEQKLPDDLNLLITLGKLDVLEGKGEDGERRLRRAIKVEPSECEARYKLVEALQLQDRKEDADAALADYQKFKATVDRTNKMLRDIADSPNAGPADCTEIGILLLSAGRPRLGVYWLGQALERDPDYQAAHQALADHYEKTGEKEKAATHRQRLVSYQAPKPSDSR